MTPGHSVPGPVSREVSKLMRRGLTPGEVQRDMARRANRKVVAVVENTELPVEL